MDLAKTNDNLQHLNTYSRTVLVTGLSINNSKQEQRSISNGRNFHSKMDFSKQLNSRNNLSSPNAMSTKLPIQSNYIPQN